MYLYKNIRTDYVQEQLVNILWCLLKAAELPAGYAEWTSWWDQLLADTDQWTHLSRSDFITRLAVSQLYSSLSKQGIFLEKSEASSCWKPVCTNNGQKV